MKREMAVDPLPSVPAARLPSLRVAVLRTGAAVPFGLCSSVAAVAASHGGYFPTSWGWTALALLAVAALALVTEVRLRRREVVFLAALCGLAAWIGLSTLWARGAGAPVSELERALVYVAGALAFVLVVSRTTAPRFLAGLAFGIAGVCGYALAGRLFHDRIAAPDPAAVYRLSEPV